MRLDPMGSVFVVFRRPASTADSVVEVTGGVASAGPGWVPTDARLEQSARGLAVWASQPVELSVRMRSGNRVPLRVANVPAAVRTRRPLGRPLHTAR